MTPCPRSPIGCGPTPTGGPRCTRPTGSSSDDPDELPVGLTLVLPARSANTPKDAAAAPTSAADSGSPSRDRSGERRTGRPRVRLDRAGAGRPATTPGRRSGGGASRTVGASHSDATSARDHRPCARPGASPRSVPLRHVGSRRPARGRAGRGRRSAGGGGGLGCRSAPSCAAAGPAGGPTDPAAVTGRPAGGGAPRAAAAADGSAHPRSGDPSDRRPLPSHRCGAAPGADGDRAERSASTSSWPHRAVDAPPGFLVDGGRWRLLGRGRRSAALDPGAPRRRPAVSGSRHPRGERRRRSDRRRPGAAAAHLGRGCGARAGRGGRCPRSRSSCPARRGPRSSR